MGGAGGRSLIPHATWFDVARLLGLSIREMQIVQNVFDDRKLEFIAYELGLSPHTVDTYLRRLYVKLQVSSRPQLILLVIAAYLKLRVSRAQATREDAT